MESERTKFQCATRGCDGCEVCATEIKRKLRYKKGLGLGDFELLIKAADRIEQLEVALREAMDWNWRDEFEDVPPDVDTACADALKCLYV